MPASAKRWRCVAPVVSPIAATSSGSFTVPLHAASASIAVASAAPVGACTTRMPPTSGAPASSAATSASSSGASGPT